MLTRIEIDGFKTFRDFALDLPPFLVLLGPNGAGKSNLSDALDFLSGLADESVLQAAQNVRGLRPFVAYERVRALSPAASKSPTRLARAGPIYPTR
ncbi:AAA family ATPase [Actinoplanes sp. NPDC051343]|uniref:AAA family ATPase n=1 Tax=Actinoplanes sp. NPDC051343 TaxID=3363906 RepID=UPI00379D097C